MDSPSFLPDASMLQMQMLLDQHQQQQGKRGRDDEDDLSSHHDRDTTNKRRGSLPPFKKRHLEVPQESDQETAHEESTAGNQQEIEARLQAFAEAQRRSKVSRQLLAKATQELHQAKQLQQQQQLMRIMALQNATKKAEQRRKSLLGPSCGSRSGSLALGGTDVFATSTARTGAAW